MLCRVRRLTLLQCYRQYRELMMDIKVFYAHITRHTQPHTMKTYCIAYSRLKDCLCRYWPYWCFLEDIHNHWDINKVVQNEVHNKVFWSITCAIMNDLGSKCFVLLTKWVHLRNIQWDCLFDLLKGFLYISSYYTTHMHWCVHRLCANNLYSNPVESPLTMYFTHYRW